MENVTLTPSHCFLGPGFLSSLPSHGTDASGHYRHWHCSANVGPRPGLRSATRRAPKRQVRADQRWSCGQSPLARAYSGHRRGADAHSGHRGGQLVFIVLMASLFVRAALPLLCSNSGLFYICDLLSILGCFYFVFFYFGFGLFLIYIYIFIYYWFFCFSPIQIRRVIFENLKSDGPAIPTLDLDALEDILVRLADPVTLKYHWTQHDCSNLLNRIVPRRAGQLIPIAKWWRVISVLARERVPTDVGFFFFFFLVCCFVLAMGQNNHYYCY